MARASYGFVSFTEIGAGHHRSYNEWHLFDHMPEQYRLDGVVYGQRWVLTPPLRANAYATPPLDRVHYVTLYLLAEPIDATLLAFQALARELRDAGRFHEHRIAHLSGAVRIESAQASSHALVEADVVPFRPHRGVHVRVGGTPVDVAQPGVAGTWSFVGDEHASPELLGQTVSWAWLDGDPHALAAPLCTSDAAFSATLELVPPFGPWDWFE